MALRCRSADGPTRPRLSREKQRNASQTLVNSKPRPWRVCEVQCTARSSETVRRGWAFSNDGRARGQARRGGLLQALSTVETLHLDAARHAKTLIKIREGFPNRNRLRLSLQYGQQPRSHGDIRGCLPQVHDEIKRGPSEQKKSSEMRDGRPHKPVVEDPTPTSMYRYRRHHTRALHPFHSISQPMPSSSTSRYLASPGHDDSDTSPTRPSPHITLH
jgi:hypothetical protein